MTVAFPIPNSGVRTGASDTAPGVAGCETSVILPGCNYPGATAPGAFPAVARVNCPWPDPNLSPNARINRFRRAALVKSYRKACADAASEAGVLPATGTWALQALHFVPPDRQARDLDNLIARFKAGQDGLADAAGTDDRDWRPQHFIHPEPERGGCVVALMVNTDIPGA